MQQLLPLLLGTAMLMPWNGLMSAFDYLNSSFPTKHPAFDISWIYQSATLVGVLGCYSAAIRKISLRKRIALPLAVFSVLFIIFPCLPNSEPAYTALLVLVAVSGLATAVLQQALLAWAGTTSRDTLVAVVQGNAVSGIVICAARVASKLLMDSTPRGLWESAAVYFGLASGFCFVCLGTFLRIGGGSGGSLHPRRPDGEQSEQLLVRVHDNDKRPETPPPRGLGTLAWNVRFPLTSTLLTFTVSLALFPSFACAVPPPPGLAADWNVLLVVCDFCVADLIGRWVADYTRSPRPVPLALFTASRALLAFPVLAMATPAGRQLFPRLLDPALSPASLPALVAVIGLTSGYCITVALAQAPPLVYPWERESAATIMAVALNSGLTAGALLSSALQAALF